MYKDKHNHHKHCQHLNVKFCVYCNVVHCLDCGEEWKKYNDGWYYRPFYTYTSDTLPLSTTTVACSHVNSN